MQTTRQSPPSLPTPPPSPARSEPQERGLRSKQEVARIRDQGAAYIEGTVPFTLHTRCHLILTILEGGTAIIQTLQIRKLSHREGKQLPQRHTARGRAQIPTESVKLLTTEPHGLLTPWPQLHRQQCCYMRQHAPVLPGTQRYEAEQDLGEAWEQGPQWALDQESGADGVSQRCCSLGHTRHTQGPTGPGSALERQVLGSRGLRFPALKGNGHKEENEKPSSTSCNPPPRLPCTLSCASQGKAVSSTAQITSTARRNPAITIMSQLHHFRDVLKITTNLAESPRLSNTLWAPKLEQGDWLLVRWEL